mmetsp:Transcript_27384/g.26446  ORF Transcript_27384/g.26446 Transcript_27384/m.26446 type:complete len:86 (-) Transcript_27384:361-618(-)
MDLLKDGEWEEQRVSLLALALRKAFKLVSTEAVCFTSRFWGVLFLQTSYSFTASLLELKLESPVLMVSADLEKVSLVAWLLPLLV